MNTYNTSKGLSIIQILISLAVIGILVAVITPRFTSFKQQQALQNTTNGIVGLLSEARTKTLASVNNTFYSVRIESARAILFAGSVYTEGLSTNKVFSYESPVVLQSTPNITISFNRLTGTISSGSNVVMQVGITGDLSLQRSITITTAGVISRN